MSFAATLKPGEKDNAPVSFWRWKEIGAVMLGHLALTALFTFPLILNFGTRMPGELIEDRDQNLWNLWWVRESLLNFRNPFRTDFIYFPESTSLNFHTLHPLNGLLSAPVQLLFGMVPAYNFVVFLSFTLAGIGAYMLLKYLCGNSPAAFAASLIFAYAPYHIGTLKGLMQLISLQWIPFYILFLLKATRERENRQLNIFLAAFFLLLNALTDWYYTLFLLGFTLLFVVWHGLVALRRRGESRLIPFVVPGLVVAVFLGLVSPVLLPMIGELNNTSYYLPDRNDTLKFSADFTAFFLPPETSTFLGWLTRDFQAQYVTGWLAAQVYLGYVTLALAIFGLFRVREARFWGFAALVFWVLSFGPALRVNGATPGWWMPYALIENLPVVKIMRSPDRFVVITMLALSVCAAFGLSKISLPLPKWPEKGRLAAAGLAGLLITIEFLQVAYPLNPFEYSPFFDRLAQDKEVYSIIQLPPQGGFYTGSPRMAEQTIHGKRIFDGYISREYDHPFQQRAPGFMELTTLKFDADIIRPASGETIEGTRRMWYDTCAYYNARYIILRLPRNDKQKATDLNKYRAAINRIAPGEAVYKDEYLEAYVIPALDNPKPFIEIGAGWYEPEKTAGTTPASYHRWAEGKANLNIGWVGPDKTGIKLNLSMLVLEGEKPARIILDGKTQVWEGHLNTAMQSLKLPLELSAGIHRLEFVVEGQANSPKALGMGNDTRRLLYLVTAVSLE
jgi:hypothetical protein